MDKKSDAFLRRLLKNWVNRHRPPDNVRARLLWDAAHTTRNKINLPALKLRPQYNYSANVRSNDWSRSLLSLINENSFQFDMSARLS